MKQKPKSFDSAGFSCVRAHHSCPKEVSGMVAAIGRNVGSEPDGRERAVRDSNAQRDTLPQQGLNQTYRYVRGFKEVSRPNESGVRKGDRS